MKINQELIDKIAKLSQLNLNKELSLNKNTLILKQIDSK